MLQLQSVDLHAWTSGSATELIAQAFSLCRRRPVIKYLPYLLIDISGFQLQSATSGAFCRFQLVQQKKVLDKLLQPPGTLLYLTKDLALFVIDRAQMPATQQIGVAEHDNERSFELMSC